ncbi:MAG: amidohydrolase family protein [Betaproteobacteria bacterium]|nr:amidohydrolase family protein [Betaproteobacteria bacterium]
MNELLIRGATVYDGTGKPGRIADVAVKDGRIAAPGSARKTLDAGGLALMPGIVDIHTHYDAQVTWDAKLSPSPALGVTTAILGNCGFGIAPCPQALRETILRNLSVVEGMDVEALLAGTRWDFETFPQYLDALERIHPYANVGVLAGHSTIRSAVMGEDASSRKVPTPEELNTMQNAVREALRVGAAGFASSFSPNHSGWGGRPMPSTICEDAELRAMVEPLKEAGRGIFVVAAGSKATPEYLEQMAADTGRPMFMVTVLTMYTDQAPGRAMTYYERCSEALQRGHEVYIHANCQPLSFDFTLREPYPFMALDAFDRVKRAKPEALPSIYADPVFRQQFRESLRNPKPGVLFSGDWSKVEIDGVPLPQLTAGKDALDYFCDLPPDTQMIAKLFQNDDAGVAPLLRHEAGVIALSDAGAHLIYFCDAGFGLHFLAHWVRGNGTFTLEEGVRRLTSDPARKYRIPERGEIRIGAFADLLLFDPAAVGLSNLRRVQDMPGGGARMIREPLGVHGVWVNGVQVHDGRDYCALARGPGRVLREFGR